eukprot:2834193-Alexandrium_andersonii.AAC.1
MECPQNPPICSGQLGWLLTHAPLHIRRWRNLEVRIEDKAAVLWVIPTGRKISRPNPAGRTSI